MSSHTTSRKRPPVRDPRALLAAVYVAKFGHLGIVLPFLAPWLRTQGFGAAAIGLLMALPPLFTIVAPWLWGRWADHSGRRRELLTVASALAALSLWALTRVDGVLLLGALFALYGFARSPILPFVEATAMEQSEVERFAYGPIRLWGSISFMLVSCLYGAVHDRLPADWGLWVAAALLASTGLLVARGFPRPLGAAAVGSESPAGTVRADHSRRSALAAGNARFFATCALMQASHGAYYTFYSIHLQNLGYGGAAIGSLWALGVFCEVVMLARLDRIVDRYGVPIVLRIALVLAAVRWLLIGSAEAWPWLAVAQTFHAATYAGFHVAAIREVYARYGATRPARGQALYSGMTYGLGIFAGSLAAGWLAERTDLFAVFFGSAAVALVATFVLGQKRSGRDRS